VSDVMMPKISGFDMLDILRSTTETKDIKVIMMTALSSEDQRARGEQLGADRYLVKSQVGIEDVVRTVHEVLGDAPVGNRTDSQMFSRPTPRPSGQPQPAQSAPAPAAQATPAPSAPEPAQPQPESPLPQPTAPFSTPRPSGLGDRVIHPISDPESSKTDVAALMDQELNAASSQPDAPAPSEPQLGPSAFQPATPADDDQSSGQSATPDAGQITTQPPQPQPVQMPQPQTPAPQPTPMPQPL